MCEILHCPQCGKLPTMLDREGKRLHRYEWVVACACGYSPCDWSKREIDAAYAWNSHIPVTMMEMTL